MQRHVFLFTEKHTKNTKTRHAEVSKYVFEKEAIDRENTRKRWKTHVVETKKTRREKRDNR